MSNSRAVSVLDDERSGTRCPPKLEQYGQDLLLDVSNCDKALLAAMDAVVHALQSTNFMRDCFPDNALSEWRAKEGLRQASRAGFASSGLWTPSRTTTRIPGPR
jgi:hypothetical protein